VFIYYVHALMPGILYAITIVSWICMNTCLFVLMVKGRLYKNEKIIVYMHTRTCTHLHANNLKITHAQLFKISFNMFPSQLCNSGMVWLRKVHQQVTMSVSRVKGLLLVLRTNHSSGKSFYILFSSNLKVNFSTQLRNIWMQNCN